MNHPRRLAFIALVLLEPALAGANLQPANPRASRAARTVLDYIGSRETQGEKRLLSGQFLGYGSTASLQLPDQIYKQTGHWPALIGVDYADFPDRTDYQRSDLSTREPNQVAIAYWRSGGLVTVSAHLYDPANPQRGGLRDQGVDLADLLAAGTAAHRRWTQELDELAAGLLELKQAGVVVLWRPFHEMNGGWFWWGKKDPAAFVRLWRSMFDYFSREKGLDNLLWVYAPNEGANAADYYPGDAHVDIVGLDAYTDFVDQSHIRGYPEITRLPKPFGFTEYGPHGAENPPGNYDYRRFLRGVEAQFPRAVLFLSWNDKWSPANNRGAKACFDDGWVVNREDLPPGLAGRAP